MQIIRLGNCSGSHFFSVIMLWISARICNAVNTGKIFHSNSIFSPSIRSNSRHWDEFSVLSLYDILDDRYLVLYMRNLPVSHRENAKHEPGSISYTIDSTHVLKQGPLHGARLGNTDRQRIYHAAHNAAKSILDRFQTCPISRESQFAIGWDEAFCAHCDNLSNEDHTYVYTADEHKRHENSWVLQLNSQGLNGPIYADAVKIKDRLYRESGGANPKNTSQQTSTAKSESTILKIQ